VNTAIPNGNPYFELMSDHLAESALELFSECGIPIEPSQQSPQQSFQAQELYCMSSIGYVGDGVRGVLVLAAPHTAAKAWTEAAGVAECDYTDTIGEFSNMLLGHLKMRLLGEGMVISLATPTTVSGASLRFSMPPGCSRWHFFDGPGWRFGARLDASFDSSFEVRAVDVTRQPAVAGETILF
jgi:CheY-specific phosphatase CheX